MTNDTEKQTARSPRPQVPDGYLLKTEVAARLRKTTRTVECWMAKGWLPHLRIGKGRKPSVLFKWPDVEAALATRFGKGIAE